MTLSMLSAWLVFHRIHLGDLRHLLIIFIDGSILTNPTQPQEPETLVPPLWLLRG
jgi:hypothetical protein